MKRILAFLFLLPALLAAQSLPSPNYNSVTANSVSTSIIRGTPTLALTNATAAATGGITQRAMPDRFAERINVKDFGAKGDGSTDDSAAFGLAVARSNTLKAAGIRVCIYIPASNYRIASAFTSFAVGNPGCVVGDGPHQTKLVIDKAFAGDVFSWTEAWVAGNYGPNTAPTTLDRVGPMIWGLGIQGDLTSANVQNAMMFYDRNDDVIVQDVSVYYLPGHAFYAGQTLTTAFGYMRESSIRNLRVENTGTVAIPAVELDSVGAGDSTNQLTFENLNVFHSAGKCVLIHNSQNAAKGTGNIRFYGIRVEACGDDNLAIGATTDVGKSVNNIWLYGFISNASAVNKASIRLTGPDAGRAPYLILVDGTITSGSGYGIVVDAGRASEFRMRDIATAQPDVVVGPSSLVGATITFSANGNERNLTYAIDPSSQSRFAVPSIRHYGDPTGVNGGTTAAYHDGTTTGGNATGAGATDMQVNRTAATQVASGTNSTLSGGLTNTVTSNAGTVGGGQANFVAGDFSCIPGGLRANDRTRYGVCGFASGFFSIAGDAQAFQAVLRAVATDANIVRLTGNQSTAGIGGNNCFNIPNNTAYTMSLDVVAIDNTNPANALSWGGWRMLMVRGASAAATTLQTTTLSAPLSTGSVAGANMSATADTGIGCLNLKFTPPTGNVDVWHIVAYVRSVEVQ